MFEKIKKNKYKILNNFCYIFCVIYFLFVLLFAGLQVIKDNNNEKKLENLLNYVASVNKKVEDQYFYNSNKNKEEISTEPIFKNGKEAVVTAYNNLLNADSFYIEANGEMNIETLGIKIKAATYTQCIKYNDNKIFEYRANKLVETNASSIIYNYIEKSTNKGSKVLKKNGKITGYEVNSSYFENNIPKINVKGSSLKEFNNNKLLYVENLFLINNNNIKSVPFYKVKYKNGVPVNYFIQVELDPISSAQNYSKVISESSNSLTPAKFSKLIISATLDCYGNITGLITSEIFTIKMDTPLGVKDCPCSVNQTYVFSGINENITYEDGDF